MRLLGQWNGGWPMDDNDITFNSDNTYISNLGGKTYLGAVSPWFFTVSIDNNIFDLDLFSEARILSALWP